MDIDNNFNYISIDQLNSPTAIHRSIDDPSIASQPSKNPFKDFCHGAEQAVAAYLLQGNENGVKHQLYFGPQNITSETIKAKKIIDSLLDDYESVSFYKKNGQFYAAIGNEKIDFSATIKRVNFNHIKLSYDQLVVYNRLFNTQNFLNKPMRAGFDNTPVDKDYFEENDPKKICKNITLAEKKAINIYTGSFHESMNALMRGKIDHCINCNGALPSYLSKTKKINLTLKETILHVTAAVGGLNKLPDYDPPKNSDGTKPQYLYRGEGEEMKELRRKAMQDGGEVTMELGFISASYEKPASSFFNEYSGNGILIKNVNGKNITPLSQFQDAEREILLPPTQLQWLYHKEVKAPNGNKLNLFLAIPVRVPFD